MIVTLPNGHKGKFFFIPPTGNRISYEAVHIYTIGDDGKIVEHRPIMDDLKFMMQLGIVKPVSSEYEIYFKKWKGIGELWHELCAYQKDQ